MYLPVINDSLNKIWKYINEKTREGEVEKEGMFTLDNKKMRSLLPKYQIELMGENEFDGKDKSDGGIAKIIADALNTIFKAGSPAGTVMNPVLTYEAILNPHVTPPTEAATVLRGVVRQFARAPTGPPKYTYLTVTFIEKLFLAGFIPASFAETQEQARAKLIPK